MIIIRRNPILGLVFIVLGLVIFFLSLGTFLFRILLALFGLLIVKIGMQMRGLPPVGFFFRNWWIRFKI